MSDELAALAARVHADLAKIGHPSMPWLRPVEGPDGRPALDVLIIGAGRVIARSFAATNDGQSKCGTDKRQPNSAASSNVSLKRLA